ncbi:MAG: family 43 glycosylhydrolase [Treponema sp.]|nr:family 43 glycosylhydrolase [Treponema sp.]
MKKITFYTLGVLFFMFNSTLNGIEVTPLQKIMAEKAVKAISENNPAVATKFTADPTVLIYNDTVYIYGTNDAQQAEYSLGKQDNSYNKISSLNIFSSKDLVNWTDCGEIAIGGKQNPQGCAKWANNSWAPAACVKKINGKDKFFIYFADNGNGIGVVCSDSPTGPFVDPIGKPLVSRSTPNCSKVYWLFDPAVLIDSDGKGYLYFGGGHQKDVAHPKSARVAALNDDMISLAGDPVEIDAPWLFEDSGINKIGNTYYYSYCSNWADRKDAKGDEVPPAAVIAYMTSSSPLGPFKYAGYTLKNPGNYFGAWGNNHHWIFEFKGKHYIAFHAQQMEKKLGFEKGGYRNICLADFKINEDGSWPIQTASNGGVKAVANFDPYTLVKGPTYATSKNAVSTNNQTLAGIAAESYVYLKNVDFSKGAESITINTGAANKKSLVKIYKDSISSENLLCQVKTKGKGSFREKMPIAKSLNLVCNIYIVFDQNSEIESWKVE